MSDLRIYVAGAWIEQGKRAKPVMKALREGGVLITHDWTLPDGAEGANVKSEYGLKTHVRLGYALADLRGVRESDVVLLLVPAIEGRGAGCFFEAGYAHARGTPLVVAGPNWRSTIFADLAIGKYDTDEAAVDAVLGREAKADGWAEPTWPADGGRGP